MMCSEKECTLLAGHLDNCPHTDGEGRQFETGYHDREAKIARMVDVIQRYKSASGSEEHEAIEYQIRDLDLPSVKPDSIIKCACGRLARARRASDNVPLCGVHARARLQAGESVILFATIHKLMITATIGSGS